MQPFKPIRQSRISAAVTDQLKRSILLGHFKSGDKLPPERELAEQFQVSRVAIREALRVLETSGFIATRQGVSGGTFVTDLTFRQLSNAFLDLFLADKISIPEVYQVRLLVEPEVARLAALNVTPGYAERLKAYLDAEDETSATLREDLERKTAVHFVLAEMCGNRFLEGLVRSVMQMTRRIIEAVHPDQPPFLHPAGMHRPIIKAVLAGNSRAAEAAMRKHATQFGKTLMELERTYRKRQAASA
ncbi:MAG TPA: FadR/GntR family transcriptional regulator [Syntrophorhabdales bacterium]|nr:FadR/GntR family transcriptional regulator [Syntrophorhabdales bacterium]